MRARTCPARTGVALLYIQGNHLSGYLRRNLYFLFGVDFAGGINRFYDGVQRHFFNGYGSFVATSLPAKNNQQQHKHNKGADNPAISFVFHGKGGGRR